MAEVFRFRGFRVYQEALRFRREVKQLTIDKFPKSEQFCLRPQIWRALDSIILNIAEGADRYSDMDFSRLLNMSLTSLNEVVGGLDCALSDKYIDQEAFNYHFSRAESLARQLKVFISKLRKS